MVGISSPDSKIARREIVSIRLLPDVIAPDGRPELCPLHAAMTARIQERVHDALLVPAKNDRLLAHSGGVEIAGLGDETLVPDEQPGACENLLQFLLVKVRIDENFAADEAPVRVNELVSIIKAAVEGHEPRTGDV